MVEPEYELRRIYRVFMKLAFQPSKFLKIFDFDV